MPFPNVYEQRPTRGARPLTEEEQKKLESELTTLRDSQNRRAGAAGAPEPPPKDSAGPPATAKAATKAPAKSPPKDPAKARPKKVAEKPRPAEPSPRKAEDSLVPDRKGPSALKPID